METKHCISVHISKDSKLLPLFKPLHSYKHTPFLIPGYVMFFVQG